MAPPPPPRAVLACVLGLTALGSGCSSWSPPPAALIQKLPAPTQTAPRYTRWEVTARVEGGSASELVGVLLVQHTPALRVRMQLYPEIGGKVMEMWLGPDGYTSLANAPLRRWQQGEPRRQRSATDGPRCEMDVLALSLRRALQPLRAEDVEGARAEPSGWRLDLGETPEGVDLEADVTADGTVTRWAFSYVTVSWALEHDGEDLVFSGDGIRVRLVRGAESHPGEVPDALFTPPSEPS